MNDPFRFYQTTIGKKIVMAVTGIIWFGYVIAHMLGNLQAFAGPEAINEYSRFLHDSPGLLWSARIVLIVSIVAHIVASVQLTRQNLDARPSSYSRRSDVATNYAARTMIWSGPLLLLFILYHVAHLTLQVTPDYEMRAHDVYNNLVHGFQIPWLSGLYVAAMVFLGLHLYHGTWSFFQSLGLNHPRYNRHRRVFATVMTALIVIGFVSVPLAVLAGVLEPVETHTVQVTTAD